MESKIENDSVIVKGKSMLAGEIELPAAKNAVLPLIAAAVISKEEIVIKNCRPLSDINKMMEIIRHLGGEAYFSYSDIVINCKYAEPRKIDEKFTGEIRSSVFLLGPLLARFGNAELCYPGGCEIGLRPIDLHIDGLKRLGVSICEKGGIICCDGKNMKAGDVCLDFPSVGATENLIMASVFLEGNTIIRNAAKEPEIRDLADFINMLGGRVYGAGTDTICVQGVKKIMGGIYRPMPDRIVAGTIMAAGAVCGGKIRLKNYCERDMKAVEAKYRQAGAKIIHEKNAASVEFCGRIKSVRKTETQPFPGFPTDMQPVFTSSLCYAAGTGVVVENLFESRFRYVGQLIKTGADVTVKDRVAIIRGKACLHGAIMKAEDLRGGAALIVAALGAEGESIITGMRHVDRGYYRIENIFLSLGANIERIKPVCQE
ncbi:MAG: UDP-N-acetylglucosamine 1-carboxyvinyltransferase [Firmicutes bacterium]|nr:UDP-N-acetylglucosamine 1-carboxyvinyltransferase [Bacillota bacterium]